MPSNPLIPKAFERIEESVFIELTAILRREAGINLPLNTKNIALVEARIGKIARKHNLSSFTDVLDRIKNNTPHALAEFVTALTTNTTHFFREDDHFTKLVQLLPPLLDLKHKSGDAELRIWCAAASTGQEPYSILMTILEAFPTLAHQGLKVLATDINPLVLEVAAEALYEPEATKGIPEHLLEKYFTRRGEDYQFDQGLKKLVRFAPFNLTQEVYPFKQGFDVIFCRNVFIYFERETIAAILKKMISHLKTGGLLFIGHAETMPAKFAELKTIAHTVYRKT